MVVTFTSAFLVGALAVRYSSGGAAADAALAMGPVLLAVAVVHTLSSELAVLPSMRGNVPSLATMTVWTREHRGRPQGPLALSHLCLTRETNAN